MFLFLPSRTVAGTLAHAFAQDPLMVYAFRDEDTRVHKLVTLFEGLERHCERVGGVVSLEDAGGAGVWAPVNRSRPGPKDLCASGLVWSPLRTGVGPILRLERAEAWGLRRLAELAEPSDGYLWALGVDPSMRGLGLGRKVVEAAIEQMGPGRRCWLKTEQPNNVSLYKRLGFELVDQRSDARTGVTTWLFAHKRS